MALDFEAEHPALRSWVGDSPAIRIGSIRPPDNWATLLVIVAAALTESCCPRIDSAKDWKFETLEVLTPMGEGPNFFTTSPNFGSIRTILRAIA
jgi:hypothetical protein